MTHTKAPPPIQPFWASFHLIHSCITPMCTPYANQNLTPVEESMLGCQKIQTQRLKNKYGPLNFFACIQQYSKPPILEYFCWENST